MHIRCPHCKVALEVVADQSVESLSCPSCGVLIEEAFCQEETLASDGKKPKWVAHYQLLEMVGQGAFGAVWKASDTKLERLVALKVPRREQFDDTMFERFVKEARAAAQVNHRNIVSVYEIGRDRDTIYIASEFIDGVSLKERLSDKRYDHREAVRLIAMLAESLHLAHEAGVVHRDLKPANVLIDGAGEPHLTDFGMAKRDAPEVTVTADGQVLGTVAYMSPEQARGESHRADRRSDVYSLGVIFYELLCGERPFRGRKSRILLYQVLHDEPPRPRSVDRSIPRDLETICLKALEKSPEKRYPTSLEMAEDLRRFLKGDPIRARPLGHAERAGRWIRRNRALSGALFIAAALLAAFVITAASLYQPPNLRRVQLATHPPGARVVFYPLDPVSREPRPELAIRPRNRSPIDIRLAPGDYLVVAVSDEPGSSFHEVFRHVPETGGVLTEYAHTRSIVTSGGAIELPAIRIPRADFAARMTEFDGNKRFIVGGTARPEIPAYARSISGFALDAGEVTLKDLEVVLPNIDAEERFKERQVATKPDFAAAFVTWDEAAAYAEKVGKRLPDEWEYEFAATLGGGRRFPWTGDAAEIVDWELGAVGIADWDVLPTDPPVVGLFSNVAEWTATGPLLYPAHRQLGLPAPQQPEEFRVVRGSVYSMVQDKIDPAEFAAADPRLRFVLPRTTTLRGVGFRCARSLQPRLAAEDFSRELRE